MKKIHVILSAAALLAVGTTGCSDFLQEYSQDSYYAHSWEDLDELLIGSCYLPVNSALEYVESGNIGEFLHFLTDEIEEQNSAVGGGVLFDSHEHLFGVYTWQQRIGQNETYTDFYNETAAWTKCYYCINVANNILAASETLPQNTDKERLGVARVQGEARFLRAYYYFWLVNLYGKPYHASTASTDLGVPLKLSENVEDKKFMRNTVQEVYAQVLSDLHAASGLLGMQTEPKKSVYRADSTAVNLLLSRVYLYMQNWEKAAHYAGRVMKAGRTLENLNGNNQKFLRKDNPEYLFSMGGSDLPCLFYFGYQGFRVSQELYNSFSGDDLRKSQWYWQYGPFVGPVRYEEESWIDTPPVSDPQYYSARYSSGKRGRYLPVSSVFLFRTAEAYLNYAEAEACLGHDGEAQSALQVLRAARYTVGSPLISQSYAGAEMVNAIREERRKELAFEGHRWFDLRRYQVCDKHPYSKTIEHYYTYYAERGSTEMKECRKFVLEPGDGGYTLGIPEVVVRFNTGMVNNERPWREYEVVDLRTN